MTHEEYIKAGGFWQSKDSDAIAMDEDKLKKCIEEYLKANNTCALATANSRFVRCTPIEYTYHNQSLYMFSEGGEKFYALEENKNVCAAVFNSFTSPKNLCGMQITGTASIIEPFSDEYNEIAEIKGILLILKKLNRPMNLIRININKIEYLNSDFQNDGVSVRQKLIFK